MKVKFRNLLLIALMTAVLSACAAPAAQPTSSAISLVDGLERPVTLEKPAVRIVSLTPSITEILFALGAGKQVVGRDSFSNFPAEATDVQDIGGSMGNYSLEAITSLQPDLVLAGEINPPELISSLENLGLTVYYLPNPESLDTLDDMLIAVGTLSGHEDEAEALAASLNDRIDVIKNKIKDVEDRPLVYYELDATDPAKPWTPGPGSYMDELIREAGGENAGSALQSAWAEISIEQLLVEDPDIILLGDSNYGVTPEQVAERAGWEGMTAVKEGKIYPFNDDLVSRPGPRLVDGLEELVKILHPDLQ
jgi:iron complex transport system substrate-binding protein